MYKKCESTLFKNVNYEVSRAESDKGVFSLVFSSKSSLLSDEYKDRKVAGLDLSHSIDQKSFETVFKIQINIKEGRPDEILKELNFVLSKAGEYNVLLSRDREDIRSKYNLFLRDNSIEYQRNIHAALGNFNPGGNAF